MSAAHRSFAILLAAALLTLSAGGPQVGDPPERFPAGHANQGLPHPEHDWRPYHADRDHVLNRIARAILLVELVPAEVAGALPRERGDLPAFRSGWVFAKRPGTPADVRLFGGDGRQLPREGFTPEESDALRGALAQLDAAVVAALQERPALAVLFQNDLLRLLRRLEETERNEELRAPLRHAVRAVALPAARWKEVGSAWDMHGPRALRTVSDAALELQRRSTRLFDAARTLAWTRVFVAVPDGREALRALLATGDEPVVPVGTHAVMLQGAVALDTQGAVHATPLILEVRTKTLANEEPLGDSNPSTSRDGVDFEVLTLRREGLRTGRDVYRAWLPDDQELFRDYGTLKHTTLRAQCSLCHRRTDTPETQLGGFSTLRPSARPRPVEDPRERLDQAVREVEAWIATWPSDGRRG